MARTELLLLDAPAGYRSREAGLFVAQLDDLLSILKGDLAGISVAELEWQPAPGMNTIGMLLAHDAIVEVFWMQAALEGRTEFDIAAVIGIHMPDDGIPCPPQGGHPKVLKGKTLRWYWNRIEEARAHLKSLVGPITPAGLNRKVEARRKDGTLRVYNIRWVLYHLVEHFAAHQGQIYLLRHQYRDRNSGKRRQPRR